MAEIDLIETIDLAAARLLDMAGFGATTASEAPKQSLPEQVKAFDAVVEWAKTRKDLRPPEKGKPKFDGIRSSFNSATRKRRGSDAPSEDSPPDAIVSDEPAVNGSDAAAPDNFFDA